MAILTTEFVVQGDFVARAVGMPDIPRAVIEHPCAGSGRDNLERVARDLAPRLLTALAGGVA